MNVSTLRMPAVLVAAATVVAGASLVVTTNTRSAVDASSPGAWVSSEGVDAVTRVGPGGPEATVTLGGSGGRLQVIEIDGAAYALDSAGQLSRIDPATFEVSVGVTLPDVELVTGAGRLYAVNRAEGVSTELDVATLNVLTAPIELGDELGSAVVDGSGVLWVVDESTGDVVRVSGPDVVSVTPMVQPGTRARLSVIGGDVVVVDPVAATVTVMGADGDAGRSHSIGGSTPAEMTGPDVLVPIAVRSGVVLPILDGSRLVTVDVRSGATAVVDLDTGDHRLGVPEVAAGYAHIADFTAGTLISVDLRTTQVAITRGLDGVSDDFDVVSKGDYLYVNDPVTEKAWVIGPDGAITEMDKYDPSNPDAGGRTPLVPRASSGGVRQEEDRLDEPADAPDDQRDDAGDDLPDFPTPSPRQSTPQVRPADPVPNNPVPNNPGTNDPVTSDPGTDDPGPDDPGGNVRGPGDDGGVGLPDVDCDDPGAATDPECVPTPGLCEEGFNAVTCPAPGDGAVRNVRVTGGDARATVTWDAPADWYDVIGYSVRVVPDGDPANAIGPIQIADLGSHTQTGLRNGRHYYFVIEAIGTGNARGAAVASERVIPISSDPGQPRDVSVTADACGSVDISWGDPDDGFDVAGYRVDVAHRGGSPAWRGDVGATVTSVSIGADELTSGDRYTVAVYSVSPSGASSPPADGGALVPHCTPGAPGDVVAIASGDGEIRVEWSAAPANGRPIDRYEVAYAGEGGSSSARTVDGDVTALSIDGLVNGRSYAVSVRAGNENGWGDPADAVSPVVPISAVPGPPRAVQVAYGDASGTVTWQVPDADGWTIAGYRVEVFVQGADAPEGGWDVPAGSTSHVVTDLVNGATYDVRVQAVGESPDGDGVRGEAATSSAFRPRTVPSASAGVTGTSTGSGEVRVEWAVPDDGGDPITHYVLSYGGSSQQVPVGQTQTQVTGLTNGQGYEFTVVAHNGEGAGAATTSDSVLVQSHTPDAPGGVNATPGDTSVTVSWSAPSGNGTTIARYVVENVTTGAGAEPTATEHTFTGLTNGTGYQFRVRAIGANSSQSGWAQATPSPVVPSGAPGLPGGVSSNPGDARITLSWSDAPGNGTTIDRYEIRGPGVDTQASSSPFDVTGLSNATSYSLEIRAVGANGVPGGWVTAPAATPSGSPAAPTGINVTTSSPHDATVTFSQVSPTNGTTVGQWRVSTVPASSTWTVDSPAATLSGLAHQTSYTVVVVAIGANGLESVDATGSFTTPNGTPPGQLTGLWANGGAMYANGTCPHPAMGGWDPTPGADGYYVSISGGAAVSYTGTSWSDAPGNGSITVTPYNIYGEGGSSGVSYAMADYGDMLCP